MLVLGRKVNEAVRIGDIRVVIVSARGGYVRLGIEAPSDVTVSRESYDWDKHHRRSQDGDDQ